MKLPTWWRFPFPPTFCNFFREKLERICCSNHKFNMKITSFMTSTCWCEEEQNFQLQIYIPIWQFCVIWHSPNKREHLLIVPNEQISRLQWIPAEYPCHQITNLCMLTHWLIRLIYLYVLIVEYSNFFSNNCAKKSNSKFKYHEFGLVSCSPHQLTHLC